MAQGQTHGRGRWWAIRPLSAEAPAISAGRAYLEVLAVFGAFFAASIAAAGFSLGGADGSPRAVSWAEAVPGSIDQVAVTALAVAVPVLLVRRRGVTLAEFGLARSRISGLPQAVRIAAWAVLGLVAGGAITSLLATGQYRTNDLSNPGLTLDLFHGLQAGPLEELVVLAFVVTTLEQARRPHAEIAVVALVLRASYHIYYGPGVVGILAWAAVFLWVYWRFRSIVPLIVVHSTWDILVMLGQRWVVFRAVDVLLWLAVWLAAFVLWLVHRSDRANRDRRPALAGPPARPALAPPGWYPDPAGSGGWRWFDGYGWTAGVHPPGRPW